jgi:TetR/AcrR family transcriptional regulator, ethionamide resistance regulator
MTVRQTPGGSRRGRGGPPKGDRRREAILNAIEVLLHERSIADLSVEDIAAAAGISRSGFYFYFPNKHAALAEALEDVRDEIFAAAAPFFADGAGEPPEVYAPRILALVADLWNRHEGVLVAMVQASASDEGARAVWDEWLGRFAAAIAERIEAERRAGRAPDGRPAAADLARALLLMNERALYDDRRRRAPAHETARLVATLSDVWLMAVWGVRRPDDGG